MSESAVSTDTDEKWRYHALTRATKRIIAREVLVTENLLMPRVSPPLEKQIQILHAVFAGFVAKQKEDVTSATMLWARRDIPPLVKPDDTAHLLLNTFAAVSQRVGWYGSSAFKAGAMRNLIRDGNHVVVAHAMPSPAELANMPGSNDLAMYSADEERTGAAAGVSFVTTERPARLTVGYIDPAEQAIYQVSLTDIRPL